ncbi:hypothetical protein N7457_009279 [Penicillium paradoxum]|uniref:uncharacterized protein n=1 Tax=Penicillium paradoxum TaxID=176176 RepID=UPI0025489133|nr:uncharacterized protein N7457_009279 [Penicillium paradoxum]KAJ5774383.1 hypothetical protein N7457_009279 [Penicillium paradoxum]
MGKDANLKWHQRWYKCIKTMPENLKVGEVDISRVSKAAKHLPSKVMAVACEGLHTRQVEFGFGLQKAPSGRQAWMKPQHFITLSQKFFNDLDMIPKVRQSSNHPRQNEQRAKAVTRALLRAVYKELHIARFAGLDDMTVLRETTSTFFPMRYMDDRKVRNVRCVARSDYAFHFGEKEAEAVNLVVIQVKCGGFCSTADGQILTYMAMAWAARKRRNQTDCTIYGCLIDSREFRFFQISHDGLWSQTILLMSLYADLRLGINTAANYLVYFLKHGLDTHSASHDGVPTSTHDRCVS